MTASKPERRTILTEDGELQDLDSLLHDPEPAAEPVYCTRCGTPNATDANYCRKCGKSMQEQMAYTADASRLEGRTKRKNDEDSRPLHVVGININQARKTESAMHPTEMNFWSMAQRLITLVFVAAMVITSFIPFEHGGNSSPAALLVLLAWFLVEAVRNDKNRHANFYSTVAEGITMLFVSGIVITSFVFGQGLLALFVLLAWFLVEAVRS